MRVRIASACGLYYLILEKEIKEKDSDSLRYIKNTFKMGKSGKVPPPATYLFSFFQTIYLKMLI